MEKSKTYNITFVGLSIKALTELHQIYGGNKSDIVRQAVIEKWTRDKDKLQKEEDYEHKGSEENS